MDKGGSKLMQMQARFQQKQMQEREMKIASLYEAQQARALERVRHSPSESLSSPPQPVPPAPHHPGKVRQMFEERRTKGIDKSYPLQPIHNTERTRKPFPNGFSKVSSTSMPNSTVRTERTNGTKVSSRVTERKSTRTVSTHSVKKQPMKTEIVNNSRDLNYNHQPDLNAGKDTLSNNGLIPSVDVLDGEGNMLEDETFPEALAPVTPREPDPPSRPPRRSPATKTSASKAAPAPTAPPRKTTIANESETKRQGAMAHRSQKHTVANTATRSSPTVANNPTRNSPSSANKRQPTTSSAGDGVPCSICGRRFAADRLQTHENICRKAQTKKRKPFDALKHRLTGTEAEALIPKLRKTAKAQSEKAKPLNSTWRKKHEEFIAAIRAAKQVQQHLNAGGKLSDLPPPPPSENPDYVPCPHCGRRFNQAAAERHIPKCASFQFNKPKPGAKPTASKRR